MKPLAALALVIVAQVAWYLVVSGAAGAATISDPSVGGAYCVLWAFGIPFVAIWSLFAAIGGRR